MTRLKDTGRRVKTRTGASRERAPGKGRYDAISPLMEKRLALHLGAADVKYGDCRNWEKGLPMSWYYDSARRHMTEYRLGDRSEDHLTAAIWNLMCIIHTEAMVQLGKLPAGFNDLPNYTFLDFNEVMPTDDAGQGPKRKPSSMKAVKAARRKR